MEKFYEIPTDSFNPVSFEDKYLFKNYEQVANFLASYLNENNKFILAKPIQKEHLVEWFSPFSNLKDVREHKDLSDHAYFKYYEFLEEIKQKISVFGSSSDKDKRSWAGILDAIFNEKDNIVFSNGEEISIIWGWNFNNSEIYKPNITPNNGEQDIVISDDVIEEDVEEVAADEFEEETEDESEDEIEDEVEDEVEEEPEKSSGFLEFLKWFASKYWWILLVLLILVAFIFTIKSLKYS